MWIKSNFNLPEPTNSNLSLLERELGFANVTTVVYKRDKETKEVKSIIQKWLDLWEE